MEATWILDGGSARLQRAPLAGRISIDRPGDGLHDLQCNGRSVAGRLATVSVRNAADAPPTTPPAPAWQVEDAYVRGDDLVVVYQPLGDHPIRWQAYWRAPPVGQQGLAELDVIVSIQTPLLESYPLVTVGSCFPAATIQWCDAEGSPCDAGVQCRIARIDVDSQLHMAEMVASKDFDSCRVEATAEHGVSTVWSMGRQFMEKGVIRRVRMRSVLTPANISSEALGRLWAELEHVAPPLTV